MREMQCLTNNFKQNTEGIDKNLKGCMLTKWWHFLWSVVSSENGCHKHPKVIEYKNQILLTEEKAAVEQKLMVKLRILDISSVQRQIQKPFLQCISPTPQPSPSAALPECENTQSGSVRVALSIKELTHLSARGG